MPRRQQGEDSSSSRPVLREKLRKLDRKIGELERRWHRGRLVNYLLVSERVLKELQGIKKLDEERKQVRLELKAFHGRRNQPTDLREG